MKRLFIIGASGHGKVCADIAGLTGYTDISFLDDNEGLIGRKIGSYDVVGNTSAAIRLGKPETTDIFVAVGDCRIREELSHRIEEYGFDVVDLIHPSAVVAKDVFIGAGTCLMAGAVINPGAVIGRGCIINTGATVDHDDIIGDYSHISVGSHLAGAVNVGKRSWIGIGAVVSNNLNICGDCVIGAGAVVVKDIVEPGTYVGAPARKLY